MPGKGGTKGRRSLHNKDTGKYKRQFARTALNKIKRMEAAGQHVPATLRMQAIPASMAERNK